MGYGSGCSLIASNGSLDVARCSLAGSESVPIQGLGDVADVLAIESGSDGCVSGELADPASFLMLRVFGPLFALGLARTVISPSIPHTMQCQGLVTVLQSAPSPPDNSSASFRGPQASPRNGSDAAERTGTACRHGSRTISCYSADSGGECHNGWLDGTSPDGRLRGLSRRGVRLLGRIVECCFPQRWFSRLRKTITGLDASVDAIAPNLVARSFCSRAFRPLNLRTCGPHISPNPTA